MKFRRHLFGFFLLVTPLFGQNTSGSANGPNAPFEGTIVPDSVQFAMSTLPQNELISARASQGFSFLLPNLEDRSYSDFPNEVVLTVYFTPWWPGCMATASQVASIIRGNFFNSSRGELTGMNDNGVPIRMILVNIFDPGIFNEDADLIDSAFSVINPYEFVGVDRESANSSSRNRFAYNYFRLGDLENGETPFASVQRRIVLVNGSTSELLFSLTPVGTSASVIPEINAEENRIINAVNSVVFVPDAPIVPEVQSISVTDIQVDDSIVGIQFESEPEVVGFMIAGSETLEGDFSIDLTEMAEIEETEPGLYKAIIDRAEAGLDERVFLQVGFGDSQ